MNGASTRSARSDDPRQGDGAPAGEWLVAIVDDDPDVHEATKLALARVAIEQRPLRFVHAYSGGEALALIAAHPDIAVALVDVVMETDTAGLDLVQQLRTALGRHALRIVLSTGHPGYVPEMQTVEAYDINAYLSKSEISRARLFTTLCTALRSFRQFVELERQRDELQRVNESLERACAAEREQTRRRAAAEEALAQAQQAVEARMAAQSTELQQSLAEIDAFSRQVAHDLRGPLHGLSGLSGLMLDEFGQTSPETCRRWLEMMHGQTRRLATLVDDLLRLARARGGRLELRPVDLNTLLDETLESLALTLPGADLAAVQAGTLPTVRGDANLLRQVFINLVGNALKFSAGRATPRIELGAVREGDAWTLSIQDNGIGFEPAQAEQLFRPFVRLHGQEVEGTGVGLSIVKAILDRHGSSIQAQGRPGGGARFSFTLPAV